MSTSIAIIQLSTPLTIPWHYISRGNSFIYVANNPSRGEAEGRVLPNSYQNVRHTWVYYAYVVNMSWCNVLIKLDIKLKNKKSYSHTQTHIYRMEDLTNILYNIQHKFSYIMYLII